jgi:hypothetical protein
MGERIKRLRAENAGKTMADAIIEFIHLMYQRTTARRVLKGLIIQLQNRYSEFNSSMGK